MRHPASTSEFSGCDFGGGVMLYGVVGGAVLPYAPEHAEPCACEDADGMRMFAPALPGAAVDVGGPCGGMARVVREACDGDPEVLVAGPSEDDAAFFARGVGDGADAGLGGELVLGGEAPTHVAEFGQDLGRTDAPCAGGTT